MIKKIICIISIIIFVACSNIGQDHFHFSEYQINDLHNFNINIKENLEVNNFEYFRKNMYKSIVNNHILEEIKKIDFSDKKIFLSDIMIKDQKFFSVLALNMEDNTFYFEIIYDYDYHSKKWVIYKVKERR